MSEPTTPYLKGSGDPLPEKPGIPIDDQSPTLKDMSTPNRGRVPPFEHLPQLRRLRTARGDRARRHGRRLSGSAAEPQSDRRPQDDPRRPARLRRRRRSLPHRGRGRRTAAASEHRLRLRSRQLRGTGILLDGVRRGDQSRPSSLDCRQDHRQTRGPSASAASHSPSTTSTRTASSPPARPQAVEHPARRPGSAARHRLRPRQAAPRIAGPDTHRHRPRHAELHVSPRAGDGAGPTSSAPASDVYSLRRDSVLSASPAGRVQGRQHLRHRPPGDPGRKRRPRGRLRFFDVERRTWN